MDREEHITKVVKRIMEDSRTFINFFSSEESYFDTMKNNSVHLARKNQEIVEQIKQQEIHLENLKAQGQQVLAEAQKESDRILEIARDNLAVSAAERAASQKIKEEAKRELSLARMKAEDFAQAAK